MCLTAGACSNEVVVPEQVQVVLGKNATLSCRVDVGANLSLTQSSWERSLPMGSVTVAVFNPQFGVSISEEYVNRVRFLNPSVKDASIVLEGVGFADIGSYICKVVTFPLGNSQASTVVEIMGMLFFNLTKFYLYNTVNCKHYHKALQVSGLRYTVDRY